MAFKHYFWILCFSPLGLFAQKTLEFPTQLEKLSEKNWNFNIDKVVDVRNAKTPNYVGRVQTGAFNAKNDAFLNKPLADELAVVVNQLLPKVKDSIELILKVNRLKVWEQTYLNTEEGFAFADFELLLKKDSIYYLVDSYNGFIKKRSGWDVTGSHLPNIVSILKSALTTFQKNQNWLNTQKWIVGDILNKKIPQIWVDSVRKKGVYRHFGEFLTNHPTLPMAYHESKGEKTVITVDEEGRKKELAGNDEFWGFCDGKNIFVCQMGDFYPVVFEKDRVTFNGFNIQKQVKRQRTGAILFGLIGSAIASATKGDLEAMEINLDSGQSFPVKDGKE